jgi:putative Mn2+ efflux pump MntP
VTFGLHFSENLRKLSKMSSIEIILLALALSIDAFAVSLSAAATGKASDARATFRLSFHFGLFQAMMPVLGWTAGLALAPVIAAIDHWVAFGLLGFIGVRMIRSSFAPGPAAESEDPSRGLTLMVLAVGTSIDALAVGLSLGLLGTDIWWPSVVIGVVTMVVCLIAIQLGRRMNASLGKRAELIGGFILLIIALRILLSHLAA